MNFGHFSSILTLALLSCPLFGEEIEVKAFRRSGNYEIRTPFALDSLDVKGKKFEFKSVLETALPTLPLKEIPDDGGSLPAIPSDGRAAKIAGFAFENNSFSKARIEVCGVEDYAAYLDGVKYDGSETALDPATHEFIIKYLCTDTSEDSLRVKISSICGDIRIHTDGGRLFSLDINTQGAGCRGVSVSPDGRWAIAYLNEVGRDGKSGGWREIIDLSDGKTVFKTRQSIEWMPTSNEYWYTRQWGGGRAILCCNPLDGSERILAKNIPEGDFTISPSEDRLIYTLTQDGPTEGDVHQILTPDDRIPGWRDRSYLASYDIASGRLQPLTFGHHNASLNDISDDGRKILFSTWRERLTARPSTLYSFYVMDLETLETTCIVKDEGFITEGDEVDGICFSPDGGEVLFKASAEAFGGIAKNVKEGQTPNMYHYLLFIMRLSDQKVRPLLDKDFGPSPNIVQWSRCDGRIYSIMEDGDRTSLICINPSNGKTQKIAVSEDNISSFSMAKSSGTALYCGQSLCWGTRIHCLDAASRKSSLIRDISESRLEGVRFGEGGSYEFRSSRGDRITAFYVLPPDFDASKKYPMLVHYYGGCSPSTRYCIGSYSPQYYAAQGYVFLVINPSGASGMGQEFAARHVNTAGDVVADDIIEAVQNFCASHSFVDASKVGCFSASYGGFMTQLLLTKTDIFATGISHAGISSHTSYWGEGYWGYSYSEVSMADSFPWTRKDLYVDRSPLYNADKIHTPLLFLHGSADTNVPIGESIQMFNALKLLGQDTAFVVVDGENHGIREYAKRRQWMRTISAWFAKYLKDDPAWWDELYPKKNL